MGFKTSTTRSSTSSKESPPNTPGQTGEKAILKQLKKWCWESDISYGSWEIFRFAHFYNFDLEETKDALESNQDNHLIRLQMRGSLLKQIEVCALFPLSGLKTKRENSEVCYFRPSRFAPQVNNTALLIKNMCYVLNDLSSTKEQCQNGVTFLANMKSYSTKLYDEHFWLELLHVLQGNVIPTKISLFLILNPPTWFGRFWKCIVLKANMSPEFYKKVRVIESEDLVDYFHEGYRSYLPEDAGHGWRETSEIVEDYIDRRLFIDKQNAKRKNATHRASLNLDLLKILEMPLEA